MSRSAETKIVVPSVEKKVMPGAFAVKIPIPDELQTAPPIDLWVEVVALTKERAQAYLEAMPENRPKKLGRIAKYAGDMVKAWPFTGQPIIISNFREMIDGQNRCHARLSSKTNRDPVVLIVYGIDKKVFPYLDNGSPRTPGDALALNGVPNHIIHATACSIILREGTKTARSATSDECLTITEANPGLSASVQWVAQHTFARQHLSPGLAAYAHYRAGQVNPLLRDTFFARFEDGANLEEGNPILLLRARVLKEKVNVKYRLKDLDRRALVIKAFNHFAAGNNLNELRWRNAGKAPEALPEWGDKHPNPAERSDRAEGERVCSVCQASGHNRQTCPKVKAA